MKIYPPQVNGPTFSKYALGKDPYRYVVISLYLYLNMTNGMINNPLTPIANTAMDVYGVTGDKVALSTAICSFASILMSLPSIKLAALLGIRWTATVGGLLLAVGFAVRVFINYNFYFVILGQIVGGLAGPLIYSIQGNIVTDWFDSTERGVWIALSALAGPIGVMIGFVFPLFFITTEDETPSEVEKSNFARYLFVQALVPGVLFLLIFLFWRKSPLLQPTEDNADDIKNKLTFAINDPEEGSITKTIDQIRRCMRKESVRSLFIVYGIGFGLVTTIGAQLTAILGCFGYPEKLGPLISVVIITSGLIGSLLYSVWFIKRRHQGKNMFLITGLSTVFMFLLAYVLMVKANYIVLTVVCALFGGIALNINVLVFEEIIRRIHEKLLITASIINATAGELFSAIMIYLIGFFVEEDNDYNGSIIVLGIGASFIFLFFFCFFTEKLMEKDDVFKKELKEKMIKETENNKETVLSMSEQE